MMSDLGEETLSPVFNSSSDVTGFNRILQAKDGGWAAALAQPTEPSACYHCSLI